MILVEGLRRSARAHLGTSRVRLLQNGGATRESADMRRLVLGLVALATVMAIAASVSARGIGVILMHGNTDSPDGTIAQLAAALKDAGYLVERPEMCWSGRRKRDRPRRDCRGEWGGPIARAPGAGARA